MEQIYGIHLPIGVKSAVTLWNIKTLVKNWLGPSRRHSAYNSKQNNIFVRIWIIIIFTTDFILLSTSQNHIWYSLIFVKSYLSNFSVVTCVKFISEDFLMYTKKSSEIIFTQVLVFSALSLNQIVCNKFLWNFTVHMLLFTYLLNHFHMYIS